MEVFLKKSPLHKARLKYIPKLPSIFSDLSLIETSGEKSKTPILDIHSFFPETSGMNFVRFQKGAKRKSEKLRVGVVFSGGQAPGGHNVVSGLFDALKKLNSNSSLLGFLNGPIGIIENKYKEITPSLIDEWRNTGGFDLLGSGRTKIEKEEQLIKALKTVKDENLDGLVVIGGDDSNTNAAVLAEYFLKHGVKTRVAGVPKTIDGDLRGENLEISFGFDTASKIYSEMIGNILKDALSSKKYYHFIKLMGRSASHITLECALATHPNLAIIGEEIAEKGKTLLEVVSDIVDLICKRAEKGKIFAVILIPEGLVEFVPELKQLIGEINLLLAQGKEEILSKLSQESQKTLKYLPKKIQDQLLLERDSHGNVPVSQIATEELLIYLVKEELKKRSDYKGKFTPLNHFFGYEGRSGFPSNFDANYCYSLGHAAALLIDANLTGYLATIYELKKSVQDWQGGGIPIASMLHMEERKGKRVAVIKKALVELDSAAFISFKKFRDKWSIDDDYRIPGPIQYFGDEELTDTIPFTI